MLLVQYQLVKLPFLHHSLIGLIMNQNVCES